MKAGETTVLKILQGSKVFLIPNFQRRYSWRAKEWELLWSDLVRELEVGHDKDAQELEGHFLGSIVLHPAAGAASVLMQHLVIDGQQRLTTILVLLAALRDIRSETEPGWDPQEYNSKYLHNPYDPEHPDRLVPTELDRHAYIETMRKGNPTDGIGQAYTYFSKKIRNLISRENISLVELGNTLLLHMILVEINTGAGDSVNNIFNTLNSKGRPLTAADLVRNELLLHVGEEQGQFAYDQLWTPMERALVVEKTTGFDDREFVTFLWSREVAFDPKATRQNLFPTFERRLRRNLEGLSSGQRKSEALRIFTEIHSEHRLFLLMRQPLSEQGLDIEIDSTLRIALERIRRWGSEPSVPLTLWLLKEAVRGRISQADAAESLNVLLGYLGRRALAGVPTNLLNRILTPIASRLSSRSSESVVENLTSFLSAPGSYWPSTREVMNNVTSQPVFVSAKRQINFLLAEAERLSTDLQLFDSSKLTVEHVMPQTLGPIWRAEIERSGVELDEARALLHTLGNLVLVEESITNPQSSFDEKRRYYATSRLRTTEMLSDASRFTPEEIERRSRMLAELLLTALPAPTNPDELMVVDDSGELHADRLESALQAMAEGEWTSEEELVEFLGIEADRLHEIANSLDPVVARLIRTTNGEIPLWFNSDLRSLILQQANPLASASRSLQPVSSERLGTLVSDVEQAASDGEDAPDIGAP